MTRLNNRNKYCIYSVVFKKILDAFMKIKKIAPFSELCIFKQSIFNFLGSFCSTVLIKKNYLDGI